MFAELKTRCLFSLLLTGSALSLGAGPMTRYDLATPFGVLERAPAEAVRWTPQAFAGDIDRVEAVVGPIADISRAEVERWHRIGVRVYAELPAEGARTNAANAYLQGFDGVVAAQSPALAEGVKDVTAYARMNELAHKVTQLKTPDKVGLEGRMGLFQLDRIAVSSDDPDVCRLEAYARIRRLAAFAKEEPGIAFDLKLVERPPLRRQELKTKRRGQPTKAEIAAALRDLRYWRCWNDTFWKYEILRSRADGEKHIGYPDPGIETFCWREFANEKLFMERRFEILRRKYAKTAELLYWKKDDPKSKPAVLDKEESEVREAYDLLPDFLNLPEEAVRLRIAYYLDRFAGRPIDPLPAVVEKKKVVLDLSADDDDLSL